MCQFSMLILMAAIGALPNADARPDGAEPGAGADFRIDNAVYLGESKEPLCRSTTIFHKGMVYDCMKAPSETIVFDMSAGRFILLNLKNRTRAELTTGEVASFADRLQEVAARSLDPLVKFLAAPKFREHVDRATGTLTLDSPLVVYRLTLLPEQDPRVMAQYHEFSDWYARLNSLLSPGSRPPFGRLVVNAALAQRSATASEVVLRLSSGGASGRGPTTIRSEHRLVRPLTAVDLDRVGQARKQMVGFKPVGFAQYRKTELR